MIAIRNAKIKQSCSDHRGVAAVECALVAPLLVMIAMGSVDAGQFVNVAQIVNDASYQGARQASQNSVIKQSEVEAAVLDYFSDQFPGVGTGDLNNALTVNVRNHLDASIPEGDMTSVPSGSAVSVEVIFKYSAVRWLHGFLGFDEISIETKAVMRRE